jgi:hypothetical protein
VIEASVCTNGQADVARHLRAPHAPLSCRCQSELLKLASPLQLIGVRLDL